MPGFRWMLHDQDGRDLRATENFASQQAAEEWMGSEWASLLEQGAESVSLVSEDGEVVYRMGLREE